MATKGLLIDLTMALACLQTGHSSWRSWSASGGRVDAHSRLEEVTEQVEEAAVNKNSWDGYRSIDWAENQRTEQSFKGVVNFKVAIDWMGARLEHDESSVEQSNLIRMTRLQSKFLKMSQTRSSYN